MGYTLDEIDNDITRVTPASFEPTIDYVVVKWPRFAFEKFPGADGSLSTHMQSVGEAMAIGRTFKQAFAKALRSRELDVERTAFPDDLLAALETPSHDRYELLFEALRQGATEEEVCSRTGIDPWFMAELAPLARGEDPEAGLQRCFKAVDTCAAEFEAATPYFYSGWEREARHEVERGEKPSVVILGSGPNRIGQGIEFDYCCVHAAMTVRESGRDAVMINCNPETVSTDYDTSRQALLRAAHDRGRARRDRAGAARGRDRAVRRADPAAPGAGAGRRRRAAARAPPWSRSTWPRTGRASAACCRSWASRARPTPPPARPRRP